MLYSCKATALYSWSRARKRESLGARALAKSPESDPRTHSTVTVITAVGVAACAT